jgi:hypothetical protein
VAGGFGQDFNRLVALMFRLPLEVAVTTMDIFLRSVQQFPALFDASADEALRRGSVEAGAPADEGESTPETLPIQPCGKEGPMSSCDDIDLSGEDAKTIEYTIIFIKPDYVATLQSKRSITIDYATTASTFKGLRIADFLEHLHRYGIRIPARWNNKVPSRRGYKERNGRIKEIPEDDRRYIVCEINLVARHPVPDPKREKEKVDVLREIRDRL